MSRAIIDTSFGVNWEIFLGWAADRRICPLHASGYWRRRHSSM